MPVLVKCPQCEMELSAPDALLGQQVGCPRCNHQFLIGNGAAGGPPAAQPPAPPAPAQGATAQFKAPRPAPSDRTTPPSQRETISMKAGVKPGPPASTPPAPASPPANSPPPTTAAPPSPPASAPLDRVSMGGPPAGDPRPTPTSAPTPTPPAAPRGRAKQAKFISADTTKSNIHLGADGQLPQLKLQEGPAKDRNKEKGQGSNTLVMIAVFGFSFGMSILMLFLPEGGPPAETTKAEALKDVQTFYIEDQPLPLEPYQILLREAKQARSRGDIEAERARYRRVLDMLHAEGKNKFKGLTGVPGGSVPPNDEHLERRLSTLLAD